MTKVRVPTGKPKFYRLVDKKFLISQRPYGCRFLGASFDPPPGWSWKQVSTNKFIFVRVKK